MIIVFKLKNQQSRQQRPILLGINTVPTLYSYTSKSHTYSSSHTLFALTKMWLFGFKSENDFLKIINKKFNSNTKIWTFDAKFLNYRNSHNPTNSHIYQNSHTFLATKMWLLSHLRILSYLSRFLQWWCHLRKKRNSRNSSFDRWGAKRW